MNKQILIGMLIVIAIVAAFALSKRKSQPQAVEPIKIGVVASLSGIAAPWGESMKNGIELAAKEINKNGGIDGRPVLVLYEDDHTDGKTAVSAYNKLVKIDGVSGVIGSVFDFNTQPLLPLAETDKMALITPPNFRIAGSFDLGEHSFSLLINFDDMIRKYKEFLGQSQIQKLGIVHFTSSWGVEISKTLNEIMLSYGKPKAIEEVYNQIGGNDYRTALIKLKNAGVDTLFFDTLGDDTVNLLKNAKALGFKPRLLTYVGSMEAFNDEKDKSLIEGITVVNWEVTSKEFDEMYMKEYSKLPGKSADKGFDALYVMADAVAHSADQTEVAAYISSHEFKTPNAVIKFTTDHTVESTPIEIDVVKNGALVPWKK